MKTKIITVTTLFSLLTALTYSCSSFNGTEAGNPTTTSAGLKIVSRDLNLSPATKSLKFSSGSVEVDSAEMVLDYISILGTGGGGVYGGPYVHDAVNDTTMPNEIPFVAVSVGTYNLISLIFHQPTAADKDFQATFGEPPLNLPDYAIKINGRRNDGVPFVAKLQETTCVALDLVNGFTVEGEMGAVLTEEEMNAAKTVFVIFDRQQWFANIDLSGAAIQNNEILLDANNNVALYNALLLNIKKSLNAAYDANGNGLLDSQEVPVSPGNLQTTGECFASTVNSSDNTAVIE